MRREYLRALAVACTLPISSLSSFAGDFTSLPPALERSLYSDAMLCYVTNGVARGMRLDVGDTEKAAIYEKQAHQAFDVASTAGRDLGYSKAQIEGDFDKTRNTELPRLVKDRDYLVSVVAHCKALKFM